MFAIAIIGAIILGIVAKADATNVRLYFSITIKDTCNGGGYTGSYIAQLKLFYDGTYICTGIVTNIPIGGPTCTYYICDITYIASDKKYQVELLQVTRSDGSCELTVNQLESGFYWSDVTDQYCNTTPSFSITL